MRYRYIALAATLLGLALGQGAAAQGYLPARPIVKPNILPKPVANRLVGRPSNDRQKDIEQTEK